MPYGGTIHSTVSADLAQADVDAIIQGIAGAAPDERTLFELYERIGQGLFDSTADMPWLEFLSVDLGYWLADPSGFPFMDLLQTDVNFGMMDINYGLIDPMGTPFMEGLWGTIDFGLLDSNMGMSWLEQVHQELVAIRAVLEDVYDSDQHALKTV